MKVKSWLIAIIICTGINSGTQAMGVPGFILPARYYDASTGRFISPDTIVQAPTDPQSLNRYAYVRNNPLNLVDPSGYSWLSKGWRDVERFAKKNNEAVGIGLQLFGGIPGFVGGSALLYQSEAGRNVLAGELLIASAVGTAYCGGCGAGWGAMAGEVAGGYTAHRSGGDILTGAVIGGAQGAFMGATMQGIDQAGMNPLMEIAVKGHVGGVMTGINGGRYEKGFTYMAIAATAELGYERMIGYQPSAGPGTGGGQYPGNVPPKDMNTIGFNGNLNGNVGDLGTQGGSVSRALNRIPTMNAFSKPHDVFMNTYVNPHNLPGVVWWPVNLGSMPPAMAFSDAALMAGPLSPLVPYIAIRY